jgi:hypothetical protein
MLRRSRNDGQAGEKSNSPSRVKCPDSHQTKENGSSCTLVLRLNQQAWWRHSRNLILIELFVDFGHHEKSSLKANDSGHSAARLFQKSFVSNNRAKLFGSVVPGQRSCQREQSFAVSSSEDYTPSVSLGI